MNKSSYIIALLMLFSQAFSTAQNLEDKTLLTIDGQKYDAGTFMKVYLKNLDIVQDDSQKDLDNYLQLYIDYRLKLLQAYEMNLQQDTDYQEELANYRKSLSENYLTDNEVSEALVQEAYNRSTQEVNASHILVKAPRTATPQDTLAAHRKITEIRNRIINGEDFAQVARSQSEGPSASIGGLLGWFGPFRMVYEFENAAYNNEVGEVSRVFRTDFGYHILKVNDKREARGDVTVAHIMTYDQREDTTRQAQQRIKEIYQQLETGKGFATMAREFSEDINSARSGGKLSRFGTGGLNSPEFEEKAFAIKNVGEYTEPFKTKYGWHIVQLLEKHPIPTFEDQRVSLEKQIKKSPRSRRITESFSQKLLDLYEVQLPQINDYDQFFPAITDSLMTNSWKLQKSGNASSTLFPIKDTQVTYKDFYDYVEKRQVKDYREYGSLEEKIKKYYDEFTVEQIINYYDKNLERDNPDFAFIYNEYKEGLLLFELMENKVWEKAKADTIGQKRFYDQHKSKYQWDQRLDIVLTQNITRDVAAQVQEFLQNDTSMDKIKEELNEPGNTQVMISTGVVEDNYARLPEAFEIREGVSKIYEKENAGFYKVIKVKDILPPGPKSFEEARGSVINDYQQQLEKQWLENLRNGRNIVVNEKVFNQIKEKVAQ